MLERPRSHFRSRTLPDTRALEARNARVSRSPNVQRKMHLLVLLTLVVAFGCSGDSSEAPQQHQRGERSVPVIVGTLEVAEFVDIIEALGTARANESVVLSAQVTETVSRVRFDDGQIVAKGDVVVELTSSEESAQLDVARANLDEAVRRHRRTVNLTREGSASQAQLDEHSSARDAARAHLAELGARARDRLIRAPFAGVLGMRSVSPGTLMQPGDPITTLDDIDIIKVDFSVPERYLALLQKGLDVNATAAAYPTRSFKGVLRSVDTRIDPRTRAVRVRADIPNADHALRPGMLMTITLHADAAQRLSIPEEAIVPVGEQHFAFVVDEEGRAARVELEIGRRRRGNVEVLGGLDGDETVVIEGASMLRPGMLARPVERSNTADTTPAPRAS